MRVEQGGKKKRKTGRIYMTFVFLAVIGIMTFQVLGLYRKREAYREVEAAKQEELKAQEARQEELIEYEVYTQSDEYVEDMAKERLGMIYDNEIIFREKP